DGDRPVLHPHLSQKALVEVGARDVGCVVGARRVERRLHVHDALAVLPVVDPKLTEIDAFFGLERRPKTIEAGLLFLRHRNVHVEAVQHERQPAAVSWRSAFPSSTPFRSSYVDLAVASWSRTQRAPSTTFARA